MEYSKTKTSLCVALKKASLVSTTRDMWTYRKKNFTCTVRQHVGLAKQKPRTRTKKVPKKMQVQITTRKKT